MDKDSLAVEFLKIYFSCYPGKLPEDEKQAFELLHKMHKKYKISMFDELKSKSEKYVDNYLDKKDKYL